MDDLSRDLCRAVVDLGGPASRRERALALARLLALALALLAGSILYWSLPPGLVGLSLLLPAGMAYALLLVATHEMVHGTLLGWPRLETLLACLLSWPMAWPYLTYSRLHRLHHRWNGRDGRDPERIQPLTGASHCPLHRLLCRTLLLSGIGLIAETLGQGWRLRAVDPRLSRCLRNDAIGLLTVQGLLLAAALRAGVPLRYLLFWLVLERVIGAIVQARGLLEHHGLWRDHGSPLLTQLYASRNVAASPWLSALMGGLPYHSAHHAFPWIASARLPAASRRLEAVLERRGLPPLPRVSGYAEGLAQLLRAQPQAQAVPTTPMSDL